MSNTSNLVLPYLAVGQAQKHVTVNESLRKLDALVQLSVVSATTTAQPASPTDGAVYIVPSGKSGAQWSAFANGCLGYYRDGAWVEIAPREGWLAFVRDSDQMLHYTGSAWALFAVGKAITVSATDKVLGRVSAGAGPAEEIVCTAAGRALIDDADAAAQRTTLGLGTAATQNTGTSGANVPLLNGANSWSGVQAAVNNAYFIADNTGTPQYLWRKSNGSANEKYWTAYSDASSWRLAVLNDALNSLTDAVIVTRSGMTLQSAAFAAKVMPATDNAHALGDGSHRFTEVFAVNGVINTSDAREKTGLRALSAAERRAIRRVMAGAGLFQRLDAVERKGAGARLHAGVTAQAVKEAFEAEGLDPARYGLFCADEVTEEVEVEPAQMEQAVEVEAGALVVARKETRAKADPATGEPLVRLGLRYEQLFAMALAALMAPEEDG